MRKGGEVRKGDEVRRGREVRQGGEAGSLDGDLPVLIIHGAAKLSSKTQRVPWNTSNMMETSLLVHSYSLFISLMIFWAFLFSTEMGVKVKQLGDGREQPCCVQSIVIMLIIFTQYMLFIVRVATRTLPTVS